MLKGRNCWHLPQWRRSFVKLSAVMAAVERNCSPRSLLPSTRWLLVLLVSPNSIIDCDLSSLHFHPLYLSSTPPPLPRLTFTHLGRCSAKCRVAVTFQTCSILLHSEMSTTSPSPLKLIPIPIPLKIPVTLSSRTSWRDKGLQFLLSARSRLLSLSSANTLSKRPALQFLCT